MSSMPDPSGLVPSESTGSGAQPPAGRGAESPGRRPGSIPAPIALDAETNAEIEAAMKEMDAEHAPRHVPPKLPPKPVTANQIRGPRVVQAGREVRPGTVVSVGPDDIFLEFGPKELGVVARQQFTDEDAPKVGDVIEVVVDQRDSDGLLNCSRPGTVKKADWEMLEPGQVIEARVSGVNKGGLELEVSSHRAFMPASQVSLDHIADLSVFVGEKIKCQVVRVDRTGKGNIVLSRRDLLEQERREQAEKLKGTLAEGQVVEGVVRKIMPFGAFVDLGGVDGLVHVSDLTHERVGHGEKAVGRYVKQGEKVRVQILKIDWEAGRLSLGIKQCTADPFAAAASEIKEGAEVNGRVTKLMEFGAFVEVSPGVEGLVHISELAWRRVGTVGEVLKQDEVVKVKVLKIDPETRRISLSIKALQSPPEPAAAPGGRGGAGRGRGRQGRDDQGRPLDEIMKVTPELRRLREKFGGKGLKGGIA